MTNDAVDSAAVLNVLLDEGVEYDASMARGLSNHLPMALLAKAALGASSVELKRFASKYVLRLRMAEGDGQTVTRATWRRAIGKPDAYADLVTFFDDEVASIGADHAVREYLGQLVGGLSGAAFHGVIRLAYALDAPSTARVGSALAYLASNAIPLAPLDEVSASTDSPAALLEQLSAGRSDEPVPPMRLISEEMQWHATRAAFGSVTSSLAVNDDTPRLLADAALKLHATTNDFTALHGVTGMEALQRLRGYVDDTATYDRLSFQALAAAYMSIGAPDIWSSDQLSEFASESLLESVEVARRAALSDDEHVAKLVFTAMRLGESTAEPLYAAIAERAVRNDKSLTAL